MQIQSLSRLSMEIFDIQRIEPVEDHLRLEHIYSHAAVSVKSKKRSSLGSRSVLTFRQGCRPVLTCSMCQDDPFPAL